VVGREVRAIIAAVVAVAALGLVAVAAGSGRAERLTPIVSLSPTPVPTLIEPSNQGGEAPAAAQPPDGSNFGTIMLTLIGIAALVVIIVLVIGRARRRRRQWGFAVGLPDPALPPDRLPRPAEVVEVLDAVEAALRRINEGEPNDAVIACWVLLEQAAARAGTAPGAADTPAELVERVLAEHRVSPGPLGRLADLYRTARYSTHPLGEDARTEAQRSLAQVRAELTGEQAEPTPEPAQ
jgi:hypothetical protein